ncbi:hypothetical protein predicted by Glimmer/Critica [Lactiplantibacillus plantarum]|nr:hypothetical protein predicted by Glimmer/Critica [Lactiplantibacillus plantarum]
MGLLKKFRLNLFDLGGTFFVALVIEATDDSK